MNKFILHIHPSVNRKMKRYAWQVRHEQGEWNLREIARRLGINVRYVSDYLTEGIEPPDTTEKGRHTRTQLFLKAYKPKPRQHRPEQPELFPGQKKIKRAIRGMVRETGDAVIRRKL